MTAAEIINSYPELTGYLFEPEFNSMIEAMESYASEREAKLQERLDLQIEVNDDLLAQNKGLMKINSMMKLITELPIHYWLEDTKEDVKKLRKQITALEKELGLNKE